MKRLIFLLMVCCVLGASAFTPMLAFAEPQAICVPWLPSHPRVPHYTYSGAEITLKGIARNGATHYRWDFGDGGGTSWTAISDSYNLGVKHKYAGVVGRLFIATLYVKDASDQESQDDYLVKIYESPDPQTTAEQTDVRIYMAVDEGLWNLHTTMLRDIYAAGSPGYGQPYGYWYPGYYPLAAVGTGVDSFQLHGSKVNGDYNSDPYVETVQRALNYLLVNTYAFAINVQPAGDPDTNGNGIGLVTNQSSSLIDNRQTYIGGIAMIALATSDAPNKVAAVGGPYVYGRAYKDIVQDMVDFFAWGQIDSGTGRGGWRYYANFSDSDMSTTQWPPLGMLAAEHNMGSTVPQFVRNELINFLDNTQSNTLDNYNGGFGYSSSSPPELQMFNVAKAAAGIIGHEFIGTSLTDPKVQKAIGYLYRHWNDNSTGWDNAELHGNSYGMYSVMKAFRLPEPDITRAVEYDYIAEARTGNSFDWYYTPTGQTQEGLASYIVRTQYADGSWDDTAGPNAVYDAFSTGWHLLVLLRGVTIIPPQAAICDCEMQDYDWNQAITLKGSCSNHPDLTRHIMGYEWDFDYNGVFTSETPTATGDTVTISGYLRPSGLPTDEVVVHPAALRVTDDNPDISGGPQQNIFVCNITVHDPPHCPHASVGGPYIGWFNAPVTFDASASWDPNNNIASYEWDLDNDGLFGAADHDCFGQPSDAVGIKPTWKWSAPFYGVIGLKVTDAEADPIDICSTYSYTSVEIGNHEPIARPGGPYTASPNSTILLNGTVSSDPDTGDTLSFAWDLDNDGDYDDSSVAQPFFTAGTLIGTVYDVCLKVADSLGKYNIACTTVKVVNRAPTALNLSNASVAEHTDTSVGYSIGTLSTTDPDSGDTFTYGITGGADAAAFSIGGSGSNELILMNGVLNYEAKSGYVVSIRSTDSGGLHVEQPFTISVINLNDLPMSSNTTVTTTEDISLTLTTLAFPFFDEDVGDGLRKVQIISRPAGTLALSGLPVTVNQVIQATELDANQLTFSPAPNATGTPYSSFQFKVYDGTAYSADAYTMTINVTPVNDAPNIDAISDETMEINTEERPTSITVQIKVGDIDTDRDSLLVSAVSSTTLVPLSGLSMQKGEVDLLDPTKINWTLTITPEAGKWGDATITVGVSDGLAAANKSFLLTILNTRVCATPSECLDGVQVPLDYGVLITFPTVSVAGQTTALMTDTEPTGACPGTENFLFETLGKCYDVHTTAQFEPPAEVCFTVSADVSSLSIQHFNTHLVTPAWEPVPITRRDVATKTICGTVDSFSWFVLALDTTAPTFTLNRLKDTLWPLDHKLVKVATVTDVADNIDPSPKVEIKVTSKDVYVGKDKDDDAEHDRDYHSSDWEVKQRGKTWEVWVRAEREGKASERIYTITATVTDRSGNQTTASHTVTVPHDKRGKNK